jgi:putative intracellular protease/amidase
VPEWFIYNEVCKLIQHQKIKTMIRFRKIILLVCILLFTGQLYAQHGAGTKGKVLLIVSNPSVSKQTGWPIGVWAAEVVHPYWEFINEGYSVDIASPEGGEVKFDGFSDPEDASKYAAFDVLSLGFKKDESKMALLKNTLKLATINPNDYKSVFVCGGQGPMYTFFNNEELHRFFVNFYLTGKPTAAICHGTCILLKTKLPNGKYLVEGKKWTGFASPEEQYADNYVGMQIQPFRIEDEARKMPNSKFVTGEPFSSFAVQDGNLITGQQQNSGTAAARLVIARLEKDRGRYPTYVLLHGAWADESAWGFIRNQLATNANVAVVNLPAHGIELTPASKVSMADYVKNVTALINKQPGKVILVAHSMGGIVASQVAENIPNKISKIIYVSAYVPRNGEDLLSLAKQDAQSKAGASLEFTTDYAAATIKKDILVEAVCADCPDFMKEVLVKYHKAEPSKPLGEKVQLSAAKFGSVPKYYISTTKDNAVGYNLQQMMIKNNGSIKKMYEMNTSHLPFVAQPQQFLNILLSIK